MAQILFPELSECPENEYEEFPQRMRDWLFRIMRELVSIALCSRVEWVSREWVWRISPENEGLALQDHQRTGEYCTVFQSWVSVQRMSMKNFPRECGTGSSGSCENSWVLHCVPELSECPENEYEEFPQRMRDWLFRIMRELVSIALCSRVEWVSREWVWRISSEIEGLALQDDQRTGEYCTVFQSWLCPENEYEEFPPRLRDWLFRMIRELVSIALCSRVEWVSWEWVWSISPENEGLALQDHQRTGVYCTVFQSWVSFLRMSMKNFPREWGTGSSGSSENWCVLHCVPELSEFPENEYEVFPQRMRDWLFRMIRELVSIALCSRVEWVSWEWVWRISPENEGLALRIHERNGEYCTVFQNWVSVQRMRMKNFPREWGTGSSDSWEKWWVLHCIPELSECPENEYEEFPQRMRDRLFRIMRELLSIALCSRVEWVSREWVWRISPENEPGSSGSWENWWVLHCVPELSFLRMSMKNFPREWAWLFRIMRELLSIALCSRVEFPENEYEEFPQRMSLALQDHERTAEYCTVFQSWVSVQRISMKNFPREWGTGSSGSWENWWVLHCVPELSFLRMSMKNFPRERGTGSSQCNINGTMGELVSIALCSRVEWVFREWVWRISPREWGTGSSGSSENWWVLHCVPELSECQRMSMKNFPREWGTGSSGSSDNWCVLHCVPELSVLRKSMKNFPR